MIHPVVVNPVLNPVVRVTDPVRWRAGKLAPDGAILHWDADLDAFTEQVGGPHTFNHAVLSPQFQRNADGSYANVGAKPGVDVFSGKKWLRSCGAVTNLLPSGAEDFTHPNWFTSRSSVIANDGYVRLVGTTDNNSHYVRRLGVGISGTYNCQIEARPGEITRLGIGTNWLTKSGAVFDLVTGVVVFSLGSATQASIVPLENGWWRCSVTLTFQSVTNETFLDFLHVKGTTEIFVGSPTEGFDIRNPQYTATSYSVPYVPPGVTQPASNAAATNGVWFANPGGSPLWQALTGQPLTLATRVRMGVGSGDLPNSVVANILSAGGGDALRYAKGADGTARVVQSHDGTGVASIDGAWPRNSIIRIITQVNTAGTQFRVGYMVEGTHTAIQWSSWANYDGSFNPSTLYRLLLGYNNPYPMWFNKITAWKKQATDAEILEAMAA